MNFPAEVVIDIVRLTIAGKLRFADDSNYFKNELSNIVLPKIENNG